LSYYSRCLSVVDDFAGLDETEHLGARADRNENGNESNRDECEEDSAHDHGGSVLVCLPVREVEWARVEGLHFTVVATFAVFGTPSGVVFKSVVKHLELISADGLDLLEHGPSDAFSARGRSQGTVVTPELLEVKGVEVALKRKRAGDRSLGCETCQVVEEHVGAGATLLGVEKDSKHGAEATVCTKMDNVHLEVVLLAHDSVLGGSVEVELNRVPVRHAIFAGQLHLATVCRLGSSKFDLDLGAITDHLDCAVILVQSVQINGNLIAALAERISQVDWRLALTVSAIRVGNFTLSSLKRAPVFSLLLVVVGDFTAVSESGRSHKRSNEGFEHIFF
jgi:hypothetical protein